MQQAVDPPDGIEAVRGFVTRTLCSKDNLQAGAFAISETPLLRGEQRCGVYFCLYGPRRLRLTAIWDLRTKAILFYGSRGERFLTTYWAEDSTSTDGGASGGRAAKAPR